MRIAGIAWFCYVALCQNLPCLMVHFVKVAGFYLSDEQKAPAGRIRGSWGIICHLIPLLKKCSLRRRKSCAIFTVLRKYCATVKLTHTLGVGYSFHFVFLHWDTCDTEETHPPSGISLDGFVW